MVDTLIYRIGELAQTQPEKTAVFFKKESLSYFQLYQKALGVSESLRGMGIAPGDRVCFSAVSKPEMIAVYLGIQACGAVSVFLDKSATPVHMAEICKIAGAKVIFTDKPMGEAEPGCPVKSLRELYNNADPSADTQAPMQPLNEDDLSEILFTSGTSGKPKGAMLSYKSVSNILMNTIEGVGYSSQTIMLLPLPLNHSFALRVLRAVLYSGGTIVLQNGFTFAKEAENNILAFDCNALACVPASYEVVKGQMQDAFVPVLSKLNVIEFSAGSLSVGQRREITDLLPEVHIHNVWGSSESGGAIFCDVTAVSKNPEAIGSLGRPLAGKVETAFLREDAPLDDPEKISGHLSEWFIETDAAHPGRMAIRGDMQMIGYWNDPVNTASTLIDGWLITGDMAYMDTNGNIFMLGRADDIINMGGEKVSPLEVENIVSQYEHIRDCACIGVEDKLLGQAPVLFVVTGMGYDETAFSKWLAGKIERTKLPQKIVTLSEIPRNRMKKIDRKELKKMWDNQDSLALMNPVVDAILSRRSIRKFTDRGIPRDVLDMVLKCGYHAPSGHNMQSWHFTVLTKEADIARLKEAAVIAAKPLKVHVYGFENPKVLILVSNDERNPDGCQDASCAAQNMMIAAQSYGIGSVWLNPLMTLRNVEPVKALLDEFGIPGNHIVWASVAIGYPVSEGVKLQKKTGVITVIP